MIRLPRRTVEQTLKASTAELETFLNSTSVAWGMCSGTAAYDYFEMEITVHPYFQPDVRRQCLTSAPEMGVPIWAAGDSYIKHTKTLGAVVGGMVAKT